MRRSTGVGVVTLMAGALLGVMSVSSASATAGCTAVTYTWKATNEAAAPKLQRGGTVTYNTGVTIPAPDPGETITVFSFSYSAFDRQPAGTSPSRADQLERNESFGIAIGGVVIGGATKDLPDTVAEGATSVNDSGIVNGVNGGAPSTLGGEIVLKHFSTIFAFDTAPNSLTVTEVGVFVNRCKTVTTTTSSTSSTSTSSTSTSSTSTSSTSTSSTSTSSTSTSTTTSSTTTTTIKPTTTTTGSSTTSTSSTTTSVASGGPTTTKPATTTSTTIVGGGGPTSVTPSTIPATGGATEHGLMGAAAVLMIIGGGMLIVRRRPA